MSEKPIYVVSDLHLGAVPAETEAAFRRWLAHAGEQASRIIINGDLFDFWFEYGSVIPGAHVRVLAALAELVESGMPVTMLGGNHDWWGGEYLTDRIGLEFHQDPITEEIFGRKTLIAHGDGLGKGDLGYRLLRLILRGRMTRLGFRWLHPDFGAWLARRVSETENRTGELSEAEKGRARFLEHWALQELERNRDLDLVLLGHSHLATVTEAGPDRYYVNSGDWIHGRSYVILAPGERPRLAEWER